MQNVSLFLENNKLPEPMNNYSTKVQPGVHEFVYTLITENIIVMYTMQTSLSLSLFLENNKLPEPMNNYSTKVLSCTCTCTNKSP